MDQLQLGVCARVIEMDIRHPSNVSILINGTSDTKITVIRSSGFFATRADDRLGNQSGHKRSHMGDAYNVAASVTSCGRPFLAPELVSTEFIHEGALEFFGQFIYLLLSVSLSLLPGFLSHNRFTVF